jgi:quercetin dioxygenase-like cupin family protein
VLSGGGTMSLDGDEIPVGQLDAVRVAPQVERWFNAGDEGLEVLVFGPRHQGDGEITPHDD